jgi:hypothetical protein
MQLALALQMDGSNKTRTRCLREGDTRARHDAGDELGDGSAQGVRADGSGAGLQRELERNLGDARSKRANAVAGRLGGAFPHKAAQSTAA